MSKLSKSQQAFIDSFLFAHAVRFGALRGHIDRTVLEDFMLRSDDDPEEALCEDYPEVYNAIWDAYLLWKAAVRWANNHQHD